jgi:hypothetical protein
MYTTASVIITASESNGSTYLLKRVKQLLRTGKVATDFDNEAR